MRNIVLIGGGASIKEGIELGLWDKIKHEEIWAINSVFLTIPYEPSVLIWVDVEFYMHNKERIKELKAVKLIAKEHTIYKKDKVYVNEYAITRVKNNKDLYNVYTGGAGLTGMFALSLASRKAYHNIYLLGYDWGTPNANDKTTHYYQDDIPKLNIQSFGAGKPMVYIDKHSQPNKFVKDFEVYKDKKNIYNVSLKSHINIFPKISYSEFFKKIERN